MTGSPTGSASEMTVGTFGACAGAETGVSSVICTVTVLEYTGSSAAPVTRQRMFAVPPYSRFATSA